MRALAHVLLAGGLVLAGGAAHAQQDYTARGMSVYAPRPVAGVRGPAAGTRVATASAPPAAAAPTVASPKAEEIRRRAKAALEEGLPRRLTVHNANTGESVSVVFWAGGEYDAWELARIGQLLRDHREKEMVAIDWRLVDLIWVLARLNGSETVHVHSGYRSARTNTWLASASSGVASDSLHISGKALDISIPGVPAPSVAALAAAMEWGGVGFYGAGGHVHVDVGPVRTWSH